MIGPCAISPAILERACEEPGCAERADYLCSRKVLDPEALGGIGLHVERLCRAHAREWCLVFRVPMPKELRS